MKTKTKKKIPTCHRTIYQSIFDDVDYKDAETLRRYINEKGKIVPRRVTGTCALHQRHISKQIKRARAIALMPYTK